MEKIIVLTTLGPTSDPRNLTLASAPYVLHHFDVGLKGVDRAELGKKRLPTGPFIITRVPNTIHGIQTHYTPPIPPHPPPTYALHVM